MLGKITLYFSFILLFPQIILLSLKVEFYFHNKKVDFNIYIYIYKHIAFVIC